MRSAWRWHRRSIITLGEAVFKGRRPCQKCGEKFLQQKAKEGGGKDETAESDPEIAGIQGETAVTDFHVRDSQPNSP